MTMQWIVIQVKRWVQPELDRTRDLLKKANRQLDHALRDNTELRNRNEQLKVQVNRLESDNKDLKHNLALLKQANDMQAETIHRMEKRQKELMDRVYDLVGRVIVLETAAGRTPELPI